MNRGVPILLPLLLALLAGCATQATPERLTAAQQAVQAAEQDPNVVQYAPLALNEAREALRKAERAARADAPLDEVDHLAYLAQRKAEIAQAVARREMVISAAEQAGEERQRILMQSREREAEQARAEAARARQEATEAQAALQDAQRQLAELSPRQTERGLTLTLSEVLFPFDSAELKPGSQRTIDRLAEYLQQHPELNVLVEGHTDSVGDRNYNQRLSERRAESVREALVSRGVDPSRIRATGMGEDYPVASNSTPAGRSENRRVELVVAEDQMPPARNQAPETMARGQSTDDPGVRPSPGG